MSESERLNPGHTTMRTSFRVLGPVLMGIGLIFTIIGLVSFFSSFGSFEPPRYFWCVFVGMPLLVIGFGITGTGFMGAMLRYQAAEAAPVGKDTFNYVADGVKPGIRDITQAVVEGVSSAQKSRYCTQCGGANDSDAKFCKACGRELRD